MLVDKNYNVSVPDFQYGWRIDKYWRIIVLIQDLEKEKS